MYYQGYNIANSAAVLTATPHVAFTTQVTKMALPKQQTRESKEYRYQFTAAVCEDNVSSLVGHGCQFFQFVSVKQVAKLLGPGNSFETTPSPVQDTWITRCWMICSSYLTSFVADVGKEWKVQEWALSIFKQPNCYALL